MGNAYGEATVALAEDAAFSLDVPRGQLSVSTKPSHWLRRSIAVDTRSGDVHGAVFVLVNGDAMVDNRVDLLDLHEVLTAFGAGGPADLDESGYVGLTDLNMVLVAFGLEGDP